MPPDANSIFSKIDNVNFDNTINLYDWYEYHNGLFYNHKRFEAFFMKTVLYHLNVSVGSLEFSFWFPSQVEVDIRIKYQSISKTESIYKTYTIHKNKTLNQL